MTSRQIEESLIAASQIQNGGEVNREFLNNHVEQALVASNRQTQEYYRPSNTVSAYKGPQEKFQEWCVKKGYNDSLALERRIMRYVNEKFEKSMRVEKKKDDGSIEITSKCYAYDILKQDIFRI